MINICTLMGRTVRDPELRRTNNDVPVCTFTLAVDRQMKGERKTDFIDCVCWNRAAEIIQQYVHKGDQFIVSGSLQIREWTDKENNKRRNAEVLVKDFSLVGGKKERDEEAEYAAAEKSGKSGGYAAQQSWADLDDPLLPF